MRDITHEQADAAYDILVRLAGARDGRHDRGAFIYHVAQAPHPTREYRFGGLLGWGGKFRNNGNYGNVPHVDCYPEHLNPEREAIISRTNEELRNLFGAG
jgi:hypothetical protein